MAGQRQAPQHDALDMSAVEVVDPDVSHVPACPIRDPAGNEAPSVTTGTAGPDGAGAGFGARHSGPTRSR
jgi:hypothetical protein